MKRILFLLSLATIVHFASFVDAQNKTWQAPLPMANPPLTTRYPNAFVPGRFQVSADDALPQSKQATSDNQARMSRRAVFPRFNYTLNRPLEMTRRFRSNRGGDIGLASQEKQEKTAKQQPQNFSTKFAANTSMNEDTSNAITVQPPMPLTEQQLGVDQFGDYVVSVESDVVVSDQLQQLLTPDHIAKPAQSVPSAQPPVVERQQPSAIPVTVPAPSKVRSNAKPIDFTTVPKKAPLLPGVDIQLEPTDHATTTQIAPVIETVVPEIVTSTKATAPDNAETNNINAAIPLPAGTVAPADANHLLDIPPQPQTGTMRAGSLGADSGSGGLQPAPAFGMGNATEPNTMELAAPAVLEEEKDPFVTIETTSPPVIIEDTKEMPQPAAESDPFAESSVPESDETETTEENVTTEPVAETPATDNEASTEDSASETEAEPETEADEADPFA